MNESEILKIKYFASDKILFDAVYKILLDNFKKSKSQDVNHLAASKIAIDMLDEAWQELESYEPRLKNNESKPSQVGL